MWILCASRLEGSGDRSTGLFFDAPKIAVEKPPAEPFKWASSTFDSREMLWIRNTGLMGA